MKEIKIDTEYIKLDQLLKYAEITQTGGHSKFLIKEGKVKVNGEECTMRGKKIRKNDIIEIEEEEKIVIK
ncbi:MAG: S4 domain-containing protein YaaA [Senegalia sp. (in: firmicutes)]|uniref:S4 domain-containing protein YaaA n=1 Tax=Senegalia sp. (in: firmicutes) TaxID=1924098 RepID=UPI003F981F44